jgi:hypothetical protein
MSRNEKSFMKNNKFFLAAIVGSAVFFLLGYLVFGMLLTNFLHDNSGLAKDVLDKFNRPMNEFNWGAMVLAHLAGGFMFATVAMWANARSLGAGLKVGAIIAFLMAVQVNCLFYGTSNLYSITSLCTHIIAITVILSITTGIMAMILGTGKTN